MSAYGCIFYPAFWSSSIHCRAPKLSITALGSETYTILYAKVMTCGPRGPRPLSNCSPILVILSRRYNQNNLPPTKYDRGYSGEVRVDNLSEKRQIKSHSHAKSQSARQVSENLTVRGADFEHTDEEAQRDIRSVAHSPRVTCRSSEVCPSPPSIDLLYGHTPRGDRNLECGVTRTANQYTIERKLMVASCGRKRFVALSRFP